MHFAQKMEMFFLENLLNLNFWIIEKVIVMKSIKKLCFEGISLRKMHLSDFKFSP